MRVTEFWRRMEAHFGLSYARSVAHDQVLRELDGHTVDEALASGGSVKEIWRAVCVHFEVPARER
jgi:hypothetical protein